MSNVLLLNASYEPLSVIPKYRAMNLLMRGCVDAATEHTVPIRGVSRSWTIPSVLRLRRYINVPRRGARWSRQAIMRRDKFTCIYCGIKLGEKLKGEIYVRKHFTIDHIIPSSRGGENSWVNTACACGKCNHRKGNRTPHEAGMPLLWEPKRPRVDYLVASGDVPQAWKLYLEVG